MVHVVHVVHVVQIIEVLMGDTLGLPRSRGMIKRWQEQCIDLARDRRELDSEEKKRKREIDLLIANREADLKILLTPPTSDNDNVNGNGSLNDNDADKDVTLAVTERSDTTTKSDASSSVVPTPNAEAAHDTNTSTLDGLVTDATSDDNNLATNGHEVEADTAGLSRSEKLKKQKKVHAAIQTEKAKEKKRLDKIKEEQRKTMKQKADKERAVMTDIQALKTRDRSEHFHYERKDNALRRKLVKVSIPVLHPCAAFVLAYIVPVRSGVVRAHVWVSSPLKHTGDCALSQR